MQGVNLNDATIDAKMAASAPLSWGMPLENFETKFSGWGLAERLKRIIPLCANGGALTGVSGLRDDNLILLVVSAIFQLLPKDPPLDFPEGAMPWPQGATGDDDPALASKPLDELGAQTIWARRVALSLLVEADELVPWSLGSFPKWQVAVMLDWRPDAAEGYGFLSELEKGTARGQKILLLNNQWTTFQIWSQNPLAAWYEAQSINAKYNPATPKAAAIAVVDWMRDTRFIHGIPTNWLVHSFADSPPPRYGDTCAAEPTGMNQLIDGASYSASFSQVCKFRWGGCPINSQYIVDVLRAMNVPACSFWVTLLLGGTVFHGPHTAVYALGSELALFHGDDALQNGYTFAGSNATWRPIVAQYYFHRVTEEFANLKLSEKSARNALAILANALGVELEALAHRDPRFRRFSGVGSSAWLLLQAQSLADNVANEKRFEIALNAFKVSLSAAQAAFQWACEASNLSSFANRRGSPARARPAKGEPNWSAIAPNLPAVLTKMAVNSQSESDKKAQAQAIVSKPFDRLRPMAELKARQNWAACFSASGGIFPANFLRQDCRAQISYGVTIATASGGKKLKADYFPESEMVGAWAVRMVAFANMFVHGSTGPNARAPKDPKVGALLWATMKDFFNLQLTVVPLAFPEDREIFWQSKCGGFVPPFVNKVGGGVKPGGGWIPQEALYHLAVFPNSPTGHQCSASSPQIADSQILESLIALLAYAVECLIWYMRLASDGVA